MSEEVRIEHCRFHHLDAVQQFIHEHWRRDHILSRDRELLLWQYSAARAKRLGMEGPSILLATTKDGIVGMLGFIPVEFNLRGRSVPGAWMALLHVIPQARTSLAGLRLLGALPAMGLDVTAVLGINERVARIYRGLRYEVLEDLPRWVAVADSDAAARLVSTGSNREACVAALSPYALRRDLSPEVAVEVRGHEHRFADDWDAFWRSRLAPGRIGTSRTADYLNWRYAEHPAFHYVRLIARYGRSEICGLAIYRIETVFGRNERVMRLVEFMATGEGSTALATRVAIDALEHRVAFADFYSGSSRLAAPLESVGFRRCGGADSGVEFPCRLQPLESGAFAMRGAFLVSKRHPEFSGGLLAADDFHVTKSDGDMDRPN